MNMLSVRFSEQAARPMGYAVITVDGIPRTLETVELALSRHGYGANNLGPDGWQGAECWLQPEEAWYNDGSLNCVIGPELVYQLENMPYTLALRGEGLAQTATMTFVWPLELELEEATTGEREPVGGTRVHPAPSRRAATAAAVEPRPAEIELPQLAEAEIGIPELSIPDYGVAAPEPGRSANREPETAPAVTPDSSAAEGPSPQASVAESEQESITSPSPPSEPQGQQLPEPDPVPATAPAPKQPAADGPETVNTKARGTGKLIAATVLLGVVVVAVVGWWLWPRQGSEMADAEANKAAATSPAPQTAPAAQPQPDSAPSVVPEPRIVSTPPVPEPRTVSTPPVPATPEPSPIAMPSVPEPRPVSTPPGPELESMPQVSVSRPPPVTLETAPAPSGVPEPDDETVTKTPVPPPAQVSPPRETTVDENLEAELESQFDGNLEATLESMLNK